MELSERKLKILKAIIDDYIDSGVPVGSRTLSKMPDFGYSSATIRNDMADLEDMGYLIQPHTSAGRVPSDTAYRMYVDRMIRIGELSRDETELIKTYFDKRVSEISEVLGSTAKALSDTTNHIAMVSAPQMDETTIKRIQLVKITETKALLVYVTDNGLVEDIMITVPQALDSRNLEQMSNMLTDITREHTLAEAVQRIQSVVQEGLDEQKSIMHEILEAININRSKKGMILEGTQNIFRYPEYKSVEKAQHFLELMDTKDRLYSLLGRSKDLEFSIHIGTENDSEDFNDMSVVTATYRIGGKQVGSVGVIGPTRMNYARVLSVLNYVSKSMNEILSYMIEGNTES